MDQFGKLANGTIIPTVANHNPALTAVCNTAAAQAVCESAVCDPKTNDCGFAVGDGPCSTDGQCVTGATCKSGICSGAIVAADGGTPAAPANPDNPGYDVIGGGCSVGDDGPVDMGLFMTGLVYLAGMVRGRRGRRQAGSQKSSTHGKAA